MIIYINNIEQFQIDTSEYQTLDIITSQEVVNKVMADSGLSGLNIKSLSYNAEKFYIETVEE